MDEIILKTNDISKSYSGVTVLDRINLEVRRGEVHALLGENGAGKSTLMKILTGVVSPDSGTITYKGKPLRLNHPKEIHDHGIGIVYQEFNLLPDLTVAQNIFIGREPGMRWNAFIHERKQNAEAAELMKRLGCDIDPARTVETLSVAQQQMVEIAKALSSNCQLLILDEPTAALTEAEIEILFDNIRKLRAQGVSFIYISHRMSDLDAVVDRVTVLRDGRLISTHDYSPEIKDDLIREMVGRDLTNKFPPRPSYERGEETLTVRDLSSGHLNLSEISFTAYKGEILGIAGLMGAGRTELAKCLFGAEPDVSGEVTLFGKRVRFHSPSQAIAAGLGYITEDRKRDGLMLDQSLRDNIVVASLERFSKMGILSDRNTNRESDSYIEKLHIRTRGRDQQVVTLSGGNQQKAVVAKWLCRNAKVLILDEPTRGIDVMAKYEIYELMYELVCQGVTVIMISSEMPEILGMSDRILVMCEGRIAGELNADEADQDTILRYAMAHYDNEK